MSVVDKMWDGITKVIKMDAKVEGLAATVVDQQKRIEDLTGRIIRLETVLEIALANKGNKQKNINQAKINFNNFLSNIQSNFDESSFAYQQIFSSNHAAKYLESILHAILHYQIDMDSWKKTLDA